MRHFLDGGWLGAVRPVQGYVILPTTLLLPLAASVSFAHLPVLMFWLATGVFALTVVMLVVPESRWGGRGTTALMAFAMVLCPGRSGDVRRLALHLLVGRALALDHPRLET